LSEGQDARRESDGGSGARPTDRAAPDPSEPTPRKRGRRRTIAVLAALLLVGAAFGGGYWYLTRNQKSTDDAFVDGDVIHIRPQVSGPVLALNITDNQRVQEGDLLLEIDPRDYQAALASAQANLDAAKGQEQAAAADLELTKVTTAAAIADAEAAVSAAEHEVDQARAEADAAAAEAARDQATVKRVQDLSENDFASQQQLDDARAAARSSEARHRAALRAVATAQAQVQRAKAGLQQANTAPQQIALKQAQLADAKGQVEQAQAAVRMAELDLSYTKIYAPAAGRVTKRAVNVGAVVQSDQELTALVTEARWVTANYKETQLTRMVPGQPVAIAVDAYPDRELAGHVDSIQAGTGARFSLLPPENATGNFVKVVQRVPVKIVFDDAEAIDRFLALGISVVPTVDVGVAPERRTAARVPGGAPAAPPVPAETADERG
jgi:membrane fusion protein (multidrug efflux system)